MNELDELIVKMWNEGLTGGQIAGTLQLSRNTVMGKITRLRAKGVQLRSIEDDVLNKKEHAPKTLKSINKRRNPKAFIYKPTKVEVVEPPIAPPVEIDTNKRWVNLADTGFKTCRYTYDGKTFCNAEGFPYCEEHIKLVYAGLNYPRRALISPKPVSALIDDNIAKSSEEDSA